MNLLLAHLRRANCIESTLEPRQEGAFVLMNYVIKRDAIRAFGLYFSKILEFDCKSVLPE